MKHKSNFTFSWKWLQKMYWRTSARRFRHILWKTLHSGCQSYFRRKDSGKAIYSPYSFFEIFEISYLPLELVTILHDPRKKSSLWETFIWQQTTIVSRTWNIDKWRTTALAEMYQITEWTDSVSYISYIRWLWKKKKYDRNIDVLKVYPSRQQRR